MDTPIEFRARIIEGNRITIRRDIFEDLGLKVGDKIKVSIEKMHRGTTVIY